MDEDERTERDEDPAVDTSMPRLTAGRLRRETVRRDMRRDYRVTARRSGNHRLSGKKPVMHQWTLARPVRVL